MSEIADDDWERGCRPSWNFPRFPCPPRPVWDLTRSSMMMTTLFLSLSFASGWISLLSCSAVCLTTIQLTAHTRTMLQIYRTNSYRSTVKWTANTIFDQTSCVRVARKHLLRSEIVKLINYSCSQKPINDNHLGQVDKSWYVMKHQIKRHHAGFHLRCQGHPKTVSYPEYF